MSTVAGFFDGVTCIPENTTELKPNQKVIITALDEFVASPSTPPKRRSGFGALKGKIYIAPDFDEPLAEFAEYS